MDTPQRAEPFDRLKGLPDIDRQPYNLIVGGRGDVLLGRYPNLVNKNVPTTIKAKPKSQIAKRYIDGANLLGALGLHEAVSVSAEAEKPSLAILKSQTARSLTIVFSGNNPEFALPPHLLVNHDTHLVLIHDRLRCFAFAGIPGLGADYEACLVNLRRIIASLQPESVVVIGISAGGAGAIKFACDLHVQGVLCFSVPTTLRLEDDEGASMASYPQLARLYRHDRSLGIDLAAYYAAHESPPPATLIYSAGHARDSWLALRMEGLPGVTLIPTDGYTGHTTYRWLTAQGKIGRYLDTLYPPLAKTELEWSGGPAPQPEKVFQLAAACNNA